MPSASLHFLKLLFQKKPAILKCVWMVAYYSSEEIPKLFAGRISCQDALVKELPVLFFLPLGQTLEWGELRSTSRQGGGLEGAGSWAWGGGWVSWGALALASPKSCHRPLKLTRLYCLYSWHERASNGQKPGRQITREDRQAILFPSPVIKKMQIMVQTLCYVLNENNVYIY